MPLFIEPLSSRGYVGPDVPSPLPFGLFGPVGLFGPRSPGVSGGVSGASFALAGGKAGAYIANSQVSPRYSASARTISGVVTTVGASGTTGRTRMTVYWSLPVAADLTAATKV